MADRIDAYGAGAGRPLDAADGDAAEIETTVIRAEIVETRERMSDTLDEIGERLNPHVLKEQVTERVKDGIRDATIGRVEHMARNAADKVSDTKSSMADTIRDNPVPAAMVAVGLGWLLWNGRSESSSGDRARFATGYGDATGRRAYGGGPYAAGYPYGGSVEHAGGYGAAAYGSETGEDRDAMDRVRDRASSVGSAAKERAHDLADRAGSAAGAVTDRAHDLADNVVDRTRRSAGRLEDTFYANPLAVGAVAAAIGLASGLAAPSTERETQLLGGARDRLVDRVKEAASETKDKAQHVAERVMDEARTASHEEGLVPG